MKIQYLILTIFTSSNFFAMEELGHLITNDRPVKKETIEERLNSICSNFDIQDHLVAKAYFKCQKKLPIEYTSLKKIKEKRDACLLQFMIYECMMRRHTSLKIEEPI